VGTETLTITDALSKLIMDKKMYATMSPGISPYGHGHAAGRIVECLKKALLTSVKD
jgi:UDP-N-acetylglucosamine 2-epimerase (non-hydrolysing)